MTKSDTASATQGDWVPLSEALAVIQDPRWSWVRNSRCKYVEFRLDTRDMHCLISDRDGKKITLKDLSRQLDTYLSPFSNSRA